MTGDNEPWELDGWALDCRTCGVCHTCLPAMRIPDNITLSEN